VLPGRGVAGERDAGARVVAGVPEDHRLHVDGGSPIVGDALDATVGDGTFAVPRLEHRTDASPQLLARIVGEGLAERPPHDLLVGVAQLLQVLGRKFGVKLDAASPLERFHRVFELHADALALGRLDPGGLFHDHVGVHRNESAIGIPDEPLVVVHRACQSGDGL